QQSHAHGCLPVGDCRLALAASTEWGVGCGSIASIFGVISTTCERITFIPTPADCLPYLEAMNARFRAKAWTHPWQTNLLSPHAEEGARSAPVSKHGRRLPLAHQGSELGQHRV